MTTLGYFGFVWGFLTSNIIFTFRITLPPSPQLKGQINLLAALQAEELGPCLGSKIRRHSLVSGSPAGHHLWCVVSSSSTQPHDCQSAPSHTAVTGLPWNSVEEATQPHQCRKEDLKKQEPIRKKLCSLWLATETSRSEDASNTQHSTPKWRLGSIPPLPCERGTKSLLQPDLTIATRLTTLADGAGGALQTCWAATRSDTLKMLVSGLRVICVFSVNSATQPKKGISRRRHQPLRQLETKPQALSSQQGSCLRNDCREDGWPWFKGSSLSFPGEVSGWKIWSWCRCCPPASSSRVRDVTQRKQISGCPGVSLHGRLQVRINFFSPGRSPVS